MASKLVYLMVSGAWHSAAIFDDFRGRLNADSVAITLPTAGSEPPIVDGNVDVAKISETVQSLIDQQKQIVVITHSYGALPTSQALKGYGRQEVAQTGGSGGVISLVLVAAPLVPVGQSIGSYWMASYKSPSWLQADLEAGRLTNLTPVELFYNDLEPATARHWAGKVTHHSTAYRHFTLQYDAWNHIPTTFVLSNKDKIAPIRDESKVREYIDNPSVEYVNAGHTPFLSKPEEMVKIVKDAVASVSQGK